MGGLGLNDHQISLGRAGDLVAHELLGQDPDGLVRSQVVGGILTGEGPGFVDDAEPSLGLFLADGDAFEGGPDVDHVIGIGVDLSEHSATEGLSALEPLVPDERHPEEPMAVKPFDVGEVVALDGNDVDSFEDPAQRSDGPCDDRVVSIRCRYRRKRDQEQLFVTIHDRSELLSYRSSPTKGSKRCQGLAFRQVSAEAEERVRQNLAQQRFRRYRFLFDTENVDDDRGQEERVDELARYLIDNIILDFQGMDVEDVRSFLREDENPTARALLSKIIEDDGIDELLFVLADCLHEHIRTGIQENTVREHLKTYIDS
jgi:hypothetical protein